MVIFSKRSHKPNLRNVYIELFSTELMDDLIQKETSVIPIPTTEKEKELLEQRKKKIINFLKKPVVWVSFFSPKFGSKAPANHFKLTRKSLQGLNL